MKTTLVLHEDQVEGFVEDFQGVETFDQLWKRSQILLRDEHNSRGVDPSRSEHAINVVYNDNAKTIAGDMVDIAIYLTRIKFNRQIKALSEENAKLKGETHGQETASKKEATIKEESTSAEEKETCQAFTCTIPFSHRSGEFGCIY